MPVQSAEEMEALAEEAFGQFSEDYRPIRLALGNIYPWSGRCGEEMYFFQEPDGSLSGIAPHFRGKSSRRVKLSNLLCREGDLPLEAAWHAYAQAGEGADAAEAYPFVFDCPNGRMFEGMPLPQVRDVQMAAFAHELSIFDSEAEYDALPSDGPKFSSESFIPSGLFGSGPPQSTGVFYGKVLETSILHSTLRGQPFQWALVETLGGQIDVVADPELVTRAIKPGGIIGGSFWLSGLLLGD